MVCYYEWYFGCGVWEYVDCLFVDLFDLCGGEYFGCGVGCCDLVVGE